MFLKEIKTIRNLAKTYDMPTYQVYSLYKNKRKRYTKQKALEETLLEMIDKRGFYSMRGDGKREYYHKLK